MWFCWSWTWTLCSLPSVKCSTWWPTIMKIFWSGLEHKGKHVTIERLIEEASQKQSLAATRRSPRKQVPEVHARRLKKGRRTTTSLITAAIAAPFLRKLRRILMSIGELKGQRAKPAWKEIMTPWWRNQSSPLCGRFHGTDRPPGLDCPVQRGGPCKQRRGAGSQLAVMMTLGESVYGLIKPTILAAETGGLK